MILPFVDELGPEYGARNTAIGDNGTAGGFPGERGTAESGRYESVS
jgi:hypothetical protein